MKKQVKKRRKKVYIDYTGPGVWKIPKEKSTGVLRIIHRRAQFSKEPSGR